MSAVAEKEAPRNTDGNQAGQNVQNQSQQDRQAGGPEAKPENGPAAKSGSEGGNEADLKEAKKEAKEDAKIAEQAYAADMGASADQKAGKSADQFKNGQDQGGQNQPGKDQQGQSAVQGQATQNATPSQQKKPEDVKTEPDLDPETAKLVDKRVEDRLKAELDKRMEPLLEVNRKLALFLGEQMEAAIELRQSVTAMARLIEGDTRRKGKYAAMLDTVKREGDGMTSGVTDPHWINRTKGMLAQLERTGTLGPKVEDVAKQA